MLVLRLENWPDGDQSRSEDLGQATLTQIGGRGDPDGEIGSYELIIMDRDTQVFKGWVDGRRRHGPWELVRLALGAIGSRIRQADEIAKE